MYCENEGAQAVSYTDIIGGKKGRKEMELASRQMT